MAVASGPGQASRFSALPLELPGRGIHLLAEWAIEGWRELHPSSPKKKSA